MLCALLQLALHHYRKVMQTHADTHIRTHAHKHTHTHTRIHTRTCVRTHTHTHTHRHTDTHTLTGVQELNKKGGLVCVSDAKADGKARFWPITVQAQGMQRLDWSREFATDQ